MSALTPFRLTPEDARRLGETLRRQPALISFEDERRLASLVASLGIQREVGTINDEFARFLFDEETGQPISRERIRSELAEYRGAIGVRIWAEGHERLELRFRGIRPLLHPSFSFREDGSIHQCVIFPETVAAIAASEDVNLVLVRDWGLNTIFGGFDPAKHYYQTNFWELENNDTIRFARLLEARQLPLLGTHDLVAHVAGVSNGAWENLTKTASHVRRTIEDYFGDLEVPTIASLVLPYTAGVLLDDLAQPPNYDAPGRHIVIDETLRAIESRHIDPATARVLRLFPSAYEKAIRLARETDVARIRSCARAAISALVDEIREHSVILGSAHSLRRKESQPIGVRV